MDQLGNQVITRTRKYQVRKPGRGNYPGAPGVPIAGGPITDVNFDMSQIDVVDVDDVPPLIDLEGLVKALSELCLFETVDGVRRKLRGLDMTSFAPINGSTATVQYGSGNYVTSSATTSTATGSIDLDSDMVRVMVDMPVGRGGPIRQHMQFSTEAIRQYLCTNPNVKIADGIEAKIELPDGGILEVDGKGGYKIEDSNAKVIYKANRIREFNRYINASDLLEEFIKFVGKLGVKQSEVLDTPIELFINWIILKAAELDGDPVPDNVTPVEKHPKLITSKNQRQTYQCLYCGRFISKLCFENGFKFCGDQHASLFHKRLVA